jgi:hypothetical protein
MMRWEGKEYFREYWEGRRGEEYKGRREEYSI